MRLSIPEFDERLASREATHRFANTLTALRGFLRTDFGSFMDPAVRDAVTVFGSRIQAFASVHHSLVEDAGEPLVDAPACFEKLCSHLCAALLEPRGIYCELRCDPGLLPREVCQKLSLIIVELVTNAAKHAFAGRHGGRVRISLLRAKEGWTCQVADNGVGLRGDHDGDGSLLVQALARSLGGELRVHSDQDGVTATLSLSQRTTPLEALRGDAYG